MKSIGALMRSGVTSAMPDEQNIRTTQQSSVLVWTTVLWLTHKRQLGQRTKRKYQPSDCLADPRRQPSFSCRLLGYKAAISEGAKLNQTFKRIEAHLLSPTGPQSKDMVDSQLEGEGVQRVELKGIGTGPREGPSEPAQLAQTTPSPAFIKENINVLRTIIKEHDQQAKAKATPKKLVYDDSEEEGSDSLRTKGLSERFSNESSGTSRTLDRASSSGKSQRSLTRGKTSSHLRRSKRLENRSKSKARTREGRAKSRGRRSEHKEASSDTNCVEDLKDTYEDLSTPYKRPKPTLFTTRITRFRFH
ncbi:hypothetical protein Tco_0915412 [Tanacetum coccineum]